MALEMGMEAALDAVVPGVTASACGKVLLTGGYLVLDPAYAGLVCAVSARFHSSVVRLEEAQLQHLLGLIADLPQAARGPLPRGRARVVISAPQVSSEPSAYELEFASSEDGQLLERFRLIPVSSRPNKFIGAALLHSLMALSTQVQSPEAFAAVLGAGIGIFVRGDDQFYTSAAAASPPPEAGGACARILPIQLASKTGLGSSATLVSSLVVALFAFFGQPLSQSAEDRDSWRLAHSVAQLAHCAAQGKVGSGFDVYCAFFGSSCYRRFEPAALAQLLAWDAEGTLGRTQILAGLRYTQGPPAAEADDRKEASVEAACGPEDPESATAWRRFYEAADRESAQFVLPPGMELVLGDVQGGSETPGMVSKVLRWRAEHPEQAGPIWSDLGANNDQVHVLFARLSAAAVADADNYRKVLELAKDAPCAQWPELQANLPESAAVQRELLGALVELAAAFARVRRGLSEMGRLAGVPIEPVGQARLLDQSLLTPGVLLAGVPGAGGEDAIFAVVLDSRCVDPLLAAWREASAALCREPDSGWTASVTRLPVQQQSQAGGGMHVRPEAKFSLRQFANFPVAWEL